MTQQSELPGSYPGTAYPQQPGQEQSGTGPAPGTFPPAGPPPKQGTNGFAIASLILGIIGWVPVSIIFGIIALTQAKKRQQSGRGLAIAGIVLSAVWIVGIVAAISLVLANGAERDETGEITEGGSVSSFDLATGDCINGLEESTNIASLPAVPCAEPHEGEVFGKFDITTGSWPGDAEIAKQAEEGCVERLEAYAPGAVDDENLEIFFLHPTEQSWAQGDDEVICVANDPTTKRTGSLRG
jgi:hypothetical protein